METSVDKIKLKTQILKDVLGEANFNHILNMYREILAEQYDLLIFVARRSFALFNAFRELLEAELKNGINQRITTDDMLGAWICTHNIPKSSCVIDDTYMYGAHLRKLVTRLYSEYEFPSSSVNIRVIYVRKMTAQDEVLIKKDKAVFGEGCTDFLTYGKSVEKDEIRRYSWDIVSAIHAVGVPYVSYIPAFSLSFDEMNSSGCKIFSFVPPVNSGERIGKEHLAPELKDWDIKNITIKPMYDFNVEAVCLFPPRKASLNGVFLRKNLECGGIEKVSAIRIYLNHKLREVTIIPYIAFDLCSSKQSILTALPDEIRNMCENESDKDAQILAHKLLRYITSYIYGKNFIRALGFTAKDKLKVSVGLGNNSPLTDLADRDNLTVLQKVWKHIESNPVKTFTPEDKKQQGMINRLIQYFNDDESKDAYAASDLLGYVSYCFLLLSESEDMRASDDRFEGICFNEMWHHIESALDIHIPDNDYAALMFRLCDWGCGVSRIVEMNQIIGTAILTGELNCCAFSIIDGGLIYAISELKSQSKAIRDVFLYYAKKFNAKLSRVIDRYVSMLEYIPVPKLEGFHPLDETAWFYMGLMKWCKQFAQDNPPTANNSPVAFSDYIRRKVDDGSLPDEVIRFVLYDM